ncbi:MAG: MATE family efflux transporter [Holophagales bacterium]|nr:MATE family efflux transporter [Holophagales bacterium]
MPASNSPGEDGAPETERHSGEASLLRRFASLSAWNILANVTVPLVGLVDAAMLGHLDDIRFLAGVALGALVFDYVFWTFAFLRMATTGLTAQASGRRDPAEMHRVLQRSVVLALGAGFLLLALRVPIGNLAFGLLSGDPGAEAAGLDYYRARVLGAPAALASFVFLGWFLGREESRVAMILTAAANLVNIALNYVFILRLGWAAEGAGLATMVSQYLMLALALAFYWPRRQGADWSLGSIFDPRAYRSMFVLQVDILVRTLFLVSAFALFTDFSARLGTAILAANTLLLRILNFAAFFIDGAAFATESLAGVFHGAGQGEMLRRLVRLALGTGLAFGALFAALVAGAPGTVLAWLTSHAEVVALGTEYRLWMIPVLLLGSLSYIYDGLFLGLTAGRVLRNAMIVSALGAFLPASLWALHQRDPHLLWAALAIFMLARVLTLGRAARHLRDR